MNGVKSMPDHSKKNAKYAKTSVIRYYYGLSNMLAFNTVSRYNKTIASLKEE